MKRIIILLISVIFPCVIFAQVQTYVQKGIVRSQSFPGKDGTRIVGAVIIRTGENVDPVYSLETPEKGYFALPMDNSEGSKVYYISSVKGPKGTQYKLMFPQPNDRLEYTPNAPLTIIMQSEKEMQDFINAATATMRRDLDRQLQDSVKVIEQLRDAQKIYDEEYNRLYNKYYDLCSDNKRLLEEYIKNIAQHDFESRASSQKEVDIAIASGNYKLAKSLLAQMGTIDEIINDIKNDSLKLKNLRTAESLTEDEIIRNKEKGIFICDRSIAAYLGSFENDSVWKYKIAKLRIEPFNVNFLCECGGFAEVYYNKYGDAKEFYLKALEQAKLQNLSKKIIAICHNHLGDVYNNLSEFALAEENYSQARLILESSKEELPQEIYDSYLGLGNVSYPQAKFGEALKFYEKCSAPDVAFINRKAYWQGRIGVGRIKLAKGDYHGAKSDFAAILNEIVSIQNIDVVTLSQAYSSMIECMATIGQYQTAIDSCNAAIKIIKKHSSPKNTYIADLLVQQGNAYINIGKIREGEQCMNEAIEIYKNILGENHPNYASACVMFANYYNLVGDLRKSEEMSNKALALLEKKFGKNHLTTIEAHFSRCQLYQTYGEFGKAQAELDTIRTIYKSSGLLNDYNRIQINISEGALKIAQGEESKVLKIYQEGIDCVTKSLGNESVQLISLYNQLAMTYLGQQDNNRVKQYLEKAQSLANLIYGVDSPTAIMQQMGMGQYYVNRGDYHKAYNLYSKIERTVVEIFGADNHQLCNIYNLLGDYYLGQYQFDKAKYYYDKLYEIIRNTYGENHYFVAEPITKIGAYFMQIGDFRKGLEKEQQAYNILSNHFDVGHKATLQSQLGICSAYIQLGQFDQAESVLIELSKAVEKKLGKNHSMYSNVLQIKATLHQSKGENSKGIECLEEAINITENIYGRHHSNTKQMYGQLSSLYMNDCKIQKAIEFNDLATEIAINFYGKDQIGVMPFLMGKGEILISLCRTKEAHAIFEKVKEKYISVWGDSCLQLCPVLIMNSIVLMHEGYTEQSIRQLEAVKQKMTVEYGDNSPLMCKIYNLLADAYLSSMHIDNAQKYYKKSLEIAEITNGKNSSACIIPLVGLGRLSITFNTKREKEAALSYLRKASIISSFAYGTRNINTAIIENQIGQLLLSQGKMDDAYEIFLNYLNILNETLEGNSNLHSRKAEAYSNFGYYYIAKAQESALRKDSIEYIARIKRAKDYFTQAKKIIDNIYGENHINAVPYMNLIANSYQQMHNTDSAAVIYKETANMYINWYGEYNPLSAQAYATLGQLYYNESNNSGLVNVEEKLFLARDCFQNAITIRHKMTKGVKESLLNYSTLMWRFSLSNIYMRLNEIEEALNTIDKVISEFEYLQSNNELADDYEEALKCCLLGCYMQKASMIENTNNNIEEMALLVNSECLIKEITLPNPYFDETIPLMIKCKLAIANEKIGDIENALHYYKETLSMITLDIQNRYPQQCQGMKEYITTKIKELSLKQ